MTPTTFTARSPEDLLAVVPVVLGFTPSESVVMLTFGSSQRFHARVDLPASPHDVTEVVSVLLEPARRHRVRQVVFVVYAADAGAAARATKALRHDFEASGIDIVDALRAHDGRWFPLIPARRPGVPAGGVPYDIGVHPFAAQSVFEGRVTHSSRAALAATLAPDAARISGVAATLSRQSWRWRRDGAEHAWAGETVSRHVRAATVPDDEEAARLLTGLQRESVRDVAWLLMSRETGRAHVALWTDLLQRAPGELASAPAALLAFAAWLAGHGALAWCAVDRCVALDPDHELAGLVAELLTTAVSPDVWGVDDSA